MQPLRDWPYMIGAITGVALATLATRGSFFVLPPSIKLPGRIERALRFAPACALTAIVVPSVLTADQQLTLSWHNNRMWAVIVASLVFARTRNMLLMMGVGMTAFTVLRLST